MLSGATTRWIVTLSMALVMNACVQRRQESPLNDMMQGRATCVRNDMPKHGKDCAR
jgi:hypothetical protein